MVEVLGHQGDREVGAQERRLEDDHADREERADGVDRPPRGVDQAPVVAARAEQDRRAGRVDAGEGRGDRAGGPSSTIGRLIIATPHRAQALHRAYESRRPVPSATSSWPSWSPPWLLGACGSDDQANDYVDQVNEIQGRLVEDVTETVSGGPPADTDAAAEVAADLQRALAGP